MGFFRSLFEICSGPYCCRELVKHSWGRVVWHFFLLCFFCSFFIGICNYFLINYRWKAAQAEFSKIFGNHLTFSSEGIFPGIEPQRSRWQELPYNSALVYVASGDKKIYQDDFFRDRNWFFLWSSSAFGFFFRNGELWNVTVYRADGETVLPEKDIKFNEMKKLFFNLVDLKTDAKWKLPENPEEVSSIQVFAMLRVGFAATVAMEYFILSFFMIAFITFFFSSLFKVFSAGRSKFITFSQLWKIALYTAFPVLAVVSFFPAFQLPGESYFTNLLMIGWVIYLFVVLKYLIQNPDNPDNSGKGENHESVQ